MRNVTDDVVGDGIVVLKFSAVWCKPCATLSPTLARIEDKNPNVSFYEVDVDRDSAFADPYGIRSVPTVIFLKDGEAKKSIVGLHSEEIYSSALAELTSAEP